nr:hypothetical protein [Candidatus Sigynarchaeota archaeon]
MIQALQEGKMLRGYIKGISAEPLARIQQRILRERKNPATFAADDYGKNSAKGTFDLRKMNQMLVYWLGEFTWL